MGRVILEFNQTIQDNKLHIIVTFFNNQVNVALSCSLKLKKF